MRIVVRFLIATEISQQCIRESVAGCNGAGGSTGIEGYVAGVNRATVLILAITNHYKTGLERMLTANEGYVIADGDIRRRR